MATSAAKLSALQRTRRFALGRVALIEPVQLDATAANRRPPTAWRLCETLALLTWPPPSRCSSRSRWTGRRTGGAEETRPSLGRPGHSPHHCMADSPATPRLLSVCTPLIQLTEPSHSGDCLPNTGTSATVTKTNQVVLGTFQCRDHLTVQGQTITKETTIEIRHGKAVVPSHMFIGWITFRRSSCL